MMVRIKNKRELPHSDISENIIGCCFEVIKDLGSGFLENVYKNALFIAMKQKGLNVLAEQAFEVYRNNLKNRDFDKEAPQNCDSERATIAGQQGARMNHNSEVKPTPAKTDSSSCFGIHHFRSKQLQRRSGVQGGTLHSDASHKIKALDKNSQSSYNVRTLYRHRS